MRSLETFRRLLLKNKAWVQERLELNPDYFKKMARDQQPEFLWVGCSDSRVPAEEITGTEPGEIFVHRNIANLVHSTDFNLLSVVQYAVEFLQVKHIIVCGHYGCGGVRAAMTNQSFGFLNKWLRNIKDTYSDNLAELEGIADLARRTDRLVELNVKEQVMNLAKTTIIQRAWLKRRMPTLHGWVYGLDNGILNELTTLPAGTKLDDIHTFHFGSEDTE